MTLVRAQTYGRMFSPVADCRGSIGAKGMQVYSRGAMRWAKRAMISRNAPCTIEIPRLGQLEWRIRFGETAHKYSGRTGIVDNLPAVAAALKSELKGGYAPNSMKPAEYARMTYHSLEQLKEMEAKKKAKGRAPGFIRTLPV